MTEQEYKQARKVLADAPDHTAIAIAIADYDYGELMHLVYLNCENEFYDFDEKQWVKMWLVDNYFHGHRRLSDLRTMVEQYERIAKFESLVEEALPIAEFACGGMTDCKAEKWVSKYDAAKIKEQG